MSESGRVTPTMAEIDLGALRENFRALRRRVGKGPRVMAVVKSNAYGHGAVPVARTLQAAGADCFGVGTVDEGTLLRKGGIRRPIIVLLGIIDGAFPALVRYRLTPVLYDLGTARRLQRFLERRGKKLDVHLKVDTGMTRIGILPEEAAPFFARLSRFKNIRPSGLMTHLADAADEGFTARQGRRFERIRKQFERHYPPPLCHVANSLASVDRRFTRYDLVRFGIALYGVYPTDRQRRLLVLKPVLRWKSRIVSIKKVPKGTPVSYGRTFVTRRPSRIALVPVGYADGYHRRLSNLAPVLVRGRRAPLAGTVCMDLIMADVTRIPSARSGDEVVLLGRQGKELITAEELGKLAGTISYEIFCHVSERIPRTYLSPS